MGSAIRLAAAALCLSCAAVAWAGDKQQGNMVNDLGLYSRDFCHLIPTYAFVLPSAAFINGTSKGKFQLKSNCDVQIKLGKLSDPGTLPVSDQLAGTGDEVVCLVHAVHGFGFPCSTIVLRGEVKGNNPLARGVSIKKNLAVETAGLCAPGSGAPLEGRFVECYEPAPFYGPGVPGACGGIGGFFVPFASDLTQGWCNAAFGYLPNPATPLIGVFGIVE